MDRIHRTDLAPLLDYQAGQCVSIFMPCTPTGRDSREDAVRLRELADQACTILVDRGMRRTEAEALLAPLRDLPNDVGAWQRRGKSLALFAGRGFFRVLHADGPLDSAVYVDDHFHVRSLLPVVA